MWGFTLFSLTDCWSEYVVFPFVHAERLFLFHFRTVVVSAIGSSMNMVDIGFIHDLVVVGSITFWVVVEFFWPR